MAPIRSRQSVSKERFSAYFGALKTVDYRDPSSRGAGSHGYVKMLFPSFGTPRTFPEIVSASRLAQREHQLICSNSQLNNRVPTLPIVMYRSRT